MGKWYKIGFKDAVEGLPSDAPMHPGHKSYADYLEGYADGERQLEVNARAEFVAAYRGSHT
jgi:hypothetical protein